MGDKKNNAKGVWPHSIHSMSGETAQKLTLRRVVVAFLPLLALIGMIVVGVAVFGRDVGGFCKATWL